MPIIEFTEDDVPSPERRAALQEQIDALREYARGLDAWERDFLDSVEDWLNTHGFLTPAQRATLERLHHQYV